MFFISLEKVFSFSRKSNFKIQHFRILWRHQMPNHKTRNILQNNLGSKHSLLLKFGQFVILQEKKFHQKFLQKLRPENQFHALLRLQRIKNNFYWTMKFLKQATFIRYVIAKLSKFVQISTLTSSDSVLRRILW